MSKGTQTYNEVTGRPISIKVLEWIARLEDRFGEERVVAGLLAEGHKRDFDKIIGRVSDRLHGEDVIGPSAGRAPRHLTAAEALAVARGEVDIKPPFTYDTQPLTPAEYTELGEWALRR